jgi:hypothetical protein
MNLMKQRLVCLMKVCLLASALIFVASCAKPGPTRLSSPSAQLFAQEPKPVPDVVILTADSAEGYRQHQRNKDEWGARGWAKVNDLCLWFEDQGVNGLPCKPDEAKVQQP